MTDSIDTSEREAEDPRGPFGLPIREMRAEPVPHLAADPLRAALQLALEATPEQLPVALDALRAALASQQPAAAPQDNDALTEVLKERDDATDFIDTLLDEVLGTDRAEWSNLYGRAEALNEVQERMAALHEPMVDRAWDRFEKVAAQPPAPPARPEKAKPVYAELVVSNCNALKTLLTNMLDEGQMERGVGAMLDEIAEGVSEAMGDAYAEGRQDQLDQDREDFAAQPEAVPQGGRWKWVPVGAAERIEEILRSEAESLRECHAPRDDWTGEPEAKADHDEWVALADLLASAPPSPQPPAAQEPENLVRGNADSYAEERSESPAYYTGWRDAERFHGIGIAPPAAQAVEHVELYGVKDGKETLLGTVPMPPRMKAREIAREMFDRFEDDDASDAAMCFAAMESLIDHMQASAAHDIGTAKPAQAEGGDRG